MEIGFRRAEEKDAPAVAFLLNGIVEERLFTALGRSFTIEDEIAFLKSLGPREGVFLVEEEEKVAGFLTLEIHHKVLGSTDHVASVGTFVAREYREKGVGSALLEGVISFARENHYEKMIAEIREKNTLGLGLYRKYGFVEVGRFRNQIKIDEEYDDVIITERFL